MNKLKLAIALGTGLTLSGLTPAARAGTIQQLSTPTLTADNFNTLFTPVAGTSVQNSPIDFVGAANAGNIQSEVFLGNAGTAAAGLYAYAYKLSVNPSNSTSGVPVHVDSTSFQFNATPTATDFAGVSTKKDVNGQIVPGTYAYVVTNGTVGDLANTASAKGSAPLVPRSLSWQTLTDETNKPISGAIRADFVNPYAGAAPLPAGDASATFAVISKQPFTGTFQNAGVLTSLQQTGVNTLVYAPSGGDISAVPIPEPTTILAWAGMAGAAVLVRRIRKNRIA